MSKVSSCLVFGGKYDEFLFSCARTTTSWRRCCPGHPPVSSSIRFAPRLPCNVGAPYRWLPVYVCVQSKLNFHQTPSPLWSFTNKLSYVNKGSAGKPISQLVDDRLTPLSRRRIQRTSWSSVATTALPGFPRRCRSASSHTRSIQMRSNVLPSLSLQAEPISFPRRYRSFSRRTKIDPG